MTDDTEEEAPKKRPSVDDPNAEFREVVVVLGPLGSGWSIGYETSGKRKK
jgi:hypothetical protein